MSSKNHYPVLGIKNRSQFVPLDLSVSGHIYQECNLETWEDEVLKIRIENPDKFLIGGYLEERFIYSNENLFGTGDKKRNIHLGVDVWQSAGTKIYAPYHSIVFGISYQEKDLDYGHVIILQHVVEGQRLYSLYGHLSSFHVGHLEVGHRIQKGDNFCTLGSKDENGGWPPHLHLQLIKDMGQQKDDYLGVCSRSEQAFYQSNCPDPSYLIYS